MKAKLTVLERLKCMELLPAENNYFTLKLIRKAKEALGFDEKESKELGLKQEGDKLFWDTSKEKEKELEFGEVITELLKDALRKLNDEKKLKEDLVSLFEKLVEAK